MDIVSLYSKIVKPVEGDRKYDVCDDFLIKQWKFGFLKELDSAIVAKYKFEPSYRNLSADAEIVQMFYNFPNEWYRSVTVTLDLLKDQWSVSGSYYETPDDSEDFETKIFNGIDKNKIVAEVGKMLKKVNSCINESVSTPIRTEVYVLKNGKGDIEDYICVAEVKGNKVVVYNPFHDEFVLTLSDLNKKYRKGSREDYEMFEENADSLVGRLVKVNEEFCPVVSEGSKRVVCVDGNGCKIVLDKSSILESESILEANSSSSSTSVDKELGKFKTFKVDLDGYGKLDAKPSFLDFKEVNGTLKGNVCYALYTKKSILLYDEYDYLDRGLFTWYAEQASKQITNKFPKAEFDSDMFYDRSMIAVIPVSISLPDKGSSEYKVLVKNLKSKYNIKL